MTGARRDGIRLLIVGASSGSLANFRGPLIRELVARGYAVVATAPDITEGDRSVVEKYGAKVVAIDMSRTGNNPFSDLGYLNAVRKLIIAERIDLVLTYMIKPNIWGGFAAKLAGVPSVGMVEGLGYYFTESGDALSRRQAVLRYIIQRLYRAANSCHKFLIFLNRDDVRDMKAAGSLTDERKVRFANGTGIDRGYYAPAPLPDAPRFLMISRLLKNKGVREYGEAAMRAKQIVPEARFDLVGTFDEGPDSIAEADLHRWIAGGLNYHGEQADVRPFLADTSVYVLPSYREGTPRSSLEAMAVGRPIITSNAPGCRETVVDGENGILVPVRDVDALVGAMVTLAKDEAGRERMGQASLAMARDRFDVAYVNNQIVTVLEEAL